MININLSNRVGDSSLSQSKSVSSDSLSTFKDFISEFKLEDENSGTNTNNKEDVDESLILYNLIYTLYEKFNIAEKIDSLTDLENIKSSLNSVYFILNVPSVSSSYNKPKRTSSSSFCNTLRHEYKNFPVFKIWLSNHVISPVA